MKKTLTVNCGSVLLLSDREHILDQYDTITFNCGGVAVSDAIYAELMKKNTMFNCGSTSILPAPKNPVRVEGRLQVEEGDSFEGMTPVCDEAVLAPECVAAVEKMEGLMVLGTLYYHQDIPLGVISGIRARNRVPYEGGSKLIFEDVTLDDAGAWQAGGRYFVTRSLFAMDGDVLRALRERDVKFRCQRLYIDEALYETHADLFTRNEELRLIPEGHAVAREAAPLLDLYVTHGEKIYLMDDLTIAKRDAKYLDKFISLIVKGEVKLPIECVGDARKKIKADAIRVFEGEYLQIDSFRTLGHDFFEAAKAQGQEYAIEVDGALILGDDVTAEDVRIITYFAVDGAALAPSATHAHLSQVGGEVDGVLLGGLSELRQMYASMPPEAQAGLAAMIPGQFRTLLGLEAGDADSTQINCGSYMLI